MVPPSSTTTTKDLSSCLDARVSIEPSGLSKTTAGWRLIKVLENGLPVYAEEGSLRARSAVSQLVSDDENEDNEDNEVIVDQFDEIKFEEGKKINGPETETIEKIHQDFNDTKIETVGQQYAQLLSQRCQPLLVRTECRQNEIRKTTDNVLRNASTWQAMHSTKQKSMTEFNEMLRILYLLQHPSPLAPTVPGRHPDAKKENQMNLVESLSSVSPFEQFRNLLFGFQQLNQQLLPLYQTIKSVQCSLAEGTSQQKFFVSILRKLSVKWNCTKIGYAPHVFEEDDTDFPFRAEIWVEIFRPSAKNIWGAEFTTSRLTALEEKMISLPNIVHDESIQTTNVGGTEYGGGNRPASESVTAADEFVMSKIEETKIRRKQDEEDFKISKNESNRHSSNMKSSRDGQNPPPTYLNPFFASHPLPTLSPWESSWCYIMVVPKGSLQTDTRNSNMTARDGRKNKCFGDNHKNKIENVQPSNVSVKASAVDIALKIVGDVGFFVRENFSLKVKLKVLKFHSNLKTDASSVQEKMAAECHQDVENETKKIEITKKENSDNDLDLVFSRIEKTLETVQKIVIDRLIHCIVVSQATIMMNSRTENASDIFSDSFFALRNSLPIDFNLLCPSPSTSSISLIQSEVESSSFSAGTVWRLLQCPAETPLEHALLGDTYQIPAEFIRIPISTISSDDNESVMWLLVKKNIFPAIVSADSVGIVCRNLPLIQRDINGTSVTQTGSIDILIDISFGPSSPNAIEDLVHVSGLELIPPSHQPLVARLRSLSALAVSKLRFLYLNIVQQAVIDTALLADIHSASLPATRTPPGGFFLSEIIDWIAGHVIVGAQNEN